MADHWIQGSFRQWQDGWPGSSRVRFASRNLESWTFSYYDQRDQHIGSTASYGSTTWVVESGTAVAVGRAGAELVPPAQLLELLGLDGYANLPRHPPRAALLQLPDGPRRFHDGDVSGELFDVDRTPSGAAIEMWCRVPLEPAALPTRALAVMTGDHPQSSPPGFRTTLDVYLGGQFVYREQDGLRRDHAGGLAWCHARSRSVDVREDPWGPTTRLRR